MILTFFHHICLRKPRLLTRKSLALPPNLSVLSTRRSILSPLSSTLSIFSVMMCFTSSISRLALLSASAGGAVLYVLSIDFRVVLKAAEPYGGSVWKFVFSGGYWAKNFFFNSSRNANGIRRPTSACATVKYVRAAWLESSSSGALDEDDGESAM